MTPKPNTTPPARLVVMLSGSGRTLLNILDHIEHGTLHATVPLVIASRPCLGEERARDRGIPTTILKGDIPADTLEQTLDAANADWLVLAGYLRRINIPPRYNNRVVNIHPALLPAFGGPGMYGHHVHEAVLAADQTESGCTVHLCDAEYDRGPILLQERVPVLPGDTPDTLAARVFEAECRIYPIALQKLITSDRTAPSPRMDP